MSDLYQITVILDGPTHANSIDGGATSDIKRTINKLSTTGIVDVDTNTWYPTHRINKVHFSIAAEKENIIEFKFATI